MGINKNYIKKRMKEITEAVNELERI